MPDHSTPAAEELLIEQALRLVKRTCRRLLPAADADDAVQATLLVFWRKRHQVARHPQPLAWFQRTAVLVCREHRRSQCRRRHHESASSLTTTSPVVEPDAELERLVEEALAELPKQQAEVLHRVYFLDQTRQQVAEHLQVPEATVHTWMRRGRQRLEAALRRRGVASAALLVLLSAGPAHAAVPSGSRLSPGAIALADGLLRRILWIRLQLSGSLVGLAVLLGATVFMLRSVAAEPSIDSTSGPVEIAASGGQYGTDLVQLTCIRPDLLLDRLYQSAAARVLSADTLTLLDGMAGIDAVEVAFLNRQIHVADTEEGRRYRAYQQSYGDLVAGYLAAQQQLKELRGSEREAASARVRDWEARLAGLKARYPDCADRSFVRPWERRLALRLQVHGPQANQFTDFWRSRLQGSVTEPERVAQTVEQAASSLSLNGKAFEALELVDLSTTPGVLRLEQRIQAAGIQPGLASQWVELTADANGLAFKGSFEIFDELGTSREAPDSSLFAEVPVAAVAAGVFDLAGFGEGLGLPSGTIAGHVLCYLSDEGFLPAVTAVARVVPQHAGLLVDALVSKYGFHPAGEGRWRLKTFPVELALIDDRLIVSSHPNGIAYHLEAERGFDEDPDIRQAIAMLQSAPSYAAVVARSGALARRLGEWSLSIPSLDQEVKLALYELGRDVQTGYTTCQVGVEGERLQVQAAGLGLELVLAVGIEHLDAVRELAAESLSLPQ